MLWVITRWWLWALLVLVAYLGVIVFLLVKREADVTGYRADEHAATVVGTTLAAAAHTSLVAAACTPQIDDFAVGDQTLHCTVQLGDGSSAAPTVGVHVAGPGEKGFSAMDVTVDAPGGAVHVGVAGG